MTATFTEADLEDPHPTDLPPDDPGSPTPARGVCQVCGKKAYHHLAFECEEHRPAEPRTNRNQSKRRSAARRRSTSSSPRPSPKRKLRDEIEGIYSLSGTMLVATGRAPITGDAVLRQAPQCADAWDQVLDQYPRARAAVEKITGAGGAVALIMAHFPIIQAARMEAAARANAMAQAA